MKDIIGIFDYIFYRAYEFGKGRTTVPITYASGIVSIIQSLLFISIISIIDFIRDYSTPAIFIYAVVIALFLALNYYKYEKNPRVDEMSERWVHEGQMNKLVKGWLIVFGIAVLVATPLLIAKIGFDYRHSSPQ